MKTFLQFSKRFIIVVLMLLSSSALFAQTTYYVSNAGNDSNNGLTEGKPWKTLAKVSTANIQPGDHVRFRRGDEFIGQLKPNYSGTQNALITFEPYGSGNKPIINGSGGSGGDFLSAIFIENQEYFHLRALEIQNERLVSKSGVVDDSAFGIYVHNNGNKIMNKFDFSDLTVRNVYAISTVGVAFDALKVAGIYFRSERNTVAGQEKHIRDVTVDNCFVTRTGKFGVWSQHAGGDEGVGSESLNRNMNYVLTNNEFFETGGSGITPGGTFNVLVENNIFNFTGSGVDPRMANRGSGAWFFNCRNVVAQYNKSYHANGSNDSYGMHIDFNNEYVLFQYNYSEDNEGFVEILGNNLYSTYRFNVSVNDGRRANKGNTFWFSNFAGSGNSVNSTNSFVYNNTVYVGKTPEGNYLEPGLQLTSNEALIANNAIYVADGADVGYKQFNRSNLVDVDNNLYFGDVRASNFTDQDNNAVFGDPLYLNPGTLDKAEDYRLGANSPALGAGSSIVEPPFPMAGIGIFANITARATVDYFGNPVDLRQAGVNIGAYNGSGESSEGTIYQAEDATLNGGATRISCANASNGAMVNGLTGVSNSVSFNVSASESSNHDVIVSYYAVNARNITYQVNGGTVVTEAVPSSGSAWCYQGGYPGEYTIQLSLASGNNNITFYDSPILDKIEVVNSPSFYFIDHIGLNLRMKSDGTDNDVELVNTSNIYTRAKWELVDAGNNYVYIQNQATGKRLQGTSSTIQNETVIKLVNGSSSGDWVQWKLTNVGSNVYIENKAHSRRLYANQGEVSFGNTNWNGNFTQWKLTGAPTSFSSKTASIKEISLLEDTEESELKIYPNPVNSGSNITINYLSKLNENLLEVRVLDFSGAKVSTEKINLLEGVQEYEIKTNGLSSGIYFINLLKEDGTSASINKIIVN